MEDYKRIDLNDYVQTGEGGTSLTYSHKDGHTLAKLYKPGFEADKEREEFLTARTVFELGIPTPEPYRLVTDGERNGAEYELIKGKRSFARIISQEPERLEEITLTFASMAKELHATKANTARLESRKEQLRRFYREKDLVPEEYKQKALRFIDQVPDATTCVHGDMQVGNIITDGKRTLWIDVGEFAYGVPEWDLSILFVMSNLMPSDRVEELFHINHETFLAHWRIFIQAYLGTTDPQAIGEATRRLLPFAAVRNPYMYDMVEHGPMPQQGIEIMIQWFE